MKQKSEQEHKYTSTGIKFWRHREQMESFWSGKGKSVISTHISPEGACNLKCPYCSVTHRDVHNRIELDVIKKYVLDLKTRGLKAVILTGGGEPTGYKHFNELVRFIKREGLSVALITNGTLTRRIDDDVLKMFSWVRISINAFEGWEDKIEFPYDKVSDDCIIGCSTVFTASHEKAEDAADPVKMLRRVSKVADNCGAQYIRLLPNCLLEQEDLIKMHDELDDVLAEVDDDRFFHQYKLHGAPYTKRCHQSYFRPYLSEVDGGTVYPCDSVVLNDAIAQFDRMYQLCRADDVLDYLDRNIHQKFDAREHCKGCVFTSNVNMLDDYKHRNIDRFDEFSHPLTHEEFV